MVGPKDLAFYCIAVEDARKRKLQSQEYFEQYFSEMY
jgi:hypothetical protein